MLYTLNLDKDKYILSISHTVNDDVELDLSEIDMLYLNAYRYEDGTVILDEERKAEIIAQDEKQAHDNHIADLKKYLNDTDYVIAETFEKVMSLNNAVTFIADFIKIMVEFKTKYSDILTARQQARAEIEDNKEAK